MQNACSTTLWERHLLWVPCPSANEFWRFLFDICAFWGVVRCVCCIYCAFHVLVQTNFRRYYFPFFIFIFARSSSNSPQSFQRFRRTLRRNFNRIQHKMKTFSIDPIVNITCFRQLYNVAESGQFLQWGSMGKLFTRLSDLNEIWHHS